MSIALLGLSIHEGDGMALLATILLSFLSTLVGIGSQWRLVLPERKAKRPVPCSDVVINYPHGAFLVVKCEEEVARSLYWSPEQCRYYRSTRWYRLISLLGTLILMFGVICLGNAGLNVQLGFAASYIILNAAYWVVAALPQRLNWDLRCYEKKKQYYRDTKTGRDGDIEESYTSALWKAIAISGTTGWVRLADVAPRSAAWDKWLGKAEEVIKEQCQLDEKTNIYKCRLDEKSGLYILPHWDCEAYLSEVLSQGNGAAKDESQSSNESMEEV